MAQISLQYTIEAVWPFILIKLVVPKDFSPAPIGKRGRSEVEIVEEDDILQ